MSDCLLVVSALCILLDWLQRGLDALKCSSVLTFLLGMLCSTGCLRCPPPRRPDAVPKQGPAVDTEKCALLLSHAGRTPPLRRWRRRLGPWATARVRR